MRCTLGVDIGTSSSKGVLVDGRGALLASATLTHEVSRPRVGHVEMDAIIWWDEFVRIARDLLDQVPEAEVGAVGVSGMGPCVLVTDSDGTPLRPAILYGVDTRAMDQVAQMSEELGEEQIRQIAGSGLSSQAAGPKLLWVAQNEPELYESATRIFMPASWLAYQLTGQYVLDHQSASQSTPLYEVETESWYQPWWNRYAVGIEQPRLLWAGDIAGNVTESAAKETGIPAGTPVIAGTIDAWTEAVSIGAHGVGDLMLMYGTTMFLVATVDQTLRTPSMWTTVGAFPGTRNLAGGMATSGALNQWFKDLTKSDYQQLDLGAEQSGVGARGLVMLPYFAGERTPILDPDARGVIAGLTLSHGPGDLFRACLESTALGIRHNVETMRSAGAQINRIVAVGGGTKGDLWLQIVSDATGLFQEVPELTIGASYGAAFLAAVSIAQPGQHPRIEDWNPPRKTVVPNPENAAAYDRIYQQYLALYLQTKEIVHELAALQTEEQ